MNTEAILLQATVLWHSFSLAFFVTFLSRTLLAETEGKRTVLPTLSLRARSIIWVMTFMGFFGVAGFLGTLGGFRTLDGVMIVIGSFLGFWSTYLLYPRSNKT